MSIAQLKKLLNIPKQLLDWWTQIGNLANHYNLQRIQVLMEFLRLRKENGISFEEYRGYGLHNPGMAWSIKTSYWPSRWKPLSRIYNTLNPEQYYCVFNNKMLFKQIFANADLPQAKTYGIYDSEFGMSEDGLPLRNSDDLFNLCRRMINGEGFVLKHVEGSQGKQVIVFNDQDNGNPDTLVSISGKRYDRETLAKELNRMESQYRRDLPHTWLVEERLKSHKDIQQISGETLSCVRIQTLVGIDNKPKLIGCMMKIANKVRSVDNLRYGGIAVEVDSETGIIGRGRLFVEKDVKWHSVLPWNGQTFTGLRIPFWKEAKDTALKAAMVFPWAKCIGWDIAITPEGPVIVEGNEMGSPHLIQSVSKQGLFIDDMRVIFERNN